MFKAFDKDLIVCEPHLSRSGAKVAFLQSHRGQSIRLCLSDKKDPLHAPWGVSSFDDAATRQNLDLVCTPSLQTFLDDLDDQVLSYLTERSETFLKGNRLGNR